MAKLRIVAFLALSASAVAGAASAQPVARPAVLAAPAWAAAPSPAVMNRLYPPAALAAGRSGGAVMRCRVAEGGRLTACATIKEYPRGEGFGDAALEASAHFRLPASIGARPTTGAMITVPVVFSNRGARVTMSRFPGDVGYLVTPRQGDAADAGAFPCPSAAEPGRVCTGHVLEWSDWVNPGTAAAALAKADQPRGLSYLECTAARSGPLTACKAANASPAAAAEMREYARLLRAPSRAADGAPVTGGRVLVEFDWSLWPASDAAGGGLLLIAEPVTAVSATRLISWRGVPSNEWMDSLLPKTAARGRINAAVVLRCRVLAGGEPADCAIAGETPAGRGFGSAMLKASKRFRFTPGRVGDVVLIPISIHGGAAPVPEMPLPAEEGAVVVDRLDVRIIRVVSE